LQEKDIKVYIVGDNSRPVYDQFSGGRIKLIKSNAKLSEYLQECLFVVLPLRLEADTENRIIQSALYQKTVLTTAIGAEGLEIGAEEIAIENKLETYSTRLLAMIQSEDKTFEMGRLLAQKVQSTYDKDAIDAGWFDYLDALFSVPVTDTGRAKLRLALITNHFGVEQDEPGIQIYQQADKLAEVYDVTVFCPRRNNKPKRDVIGKLTVFRMFDILNYPVEFPNLKEKTLCLDLFTHLMKSNFDLIQCYPRLNYNNALAFMAAKCKETPIVMSVVGFLDYARLSQPEKRIDPDILQHTTLKWYEKLIIRNMDYIFTSSEKEYAFLRKFTERLEQIPMPVRTEENIMHFPSFREEHQIEENAFIFVCAGEFSYLNGQDIALKAFTRALPLLPDARLVFIGELDKESEFYEDMASFIEREALESEIIFVNSSDPNERLAWLNDADICVIPARFKNAGIEAVESWMCNIPVLQSDAIDPDLVVEGINGYLFCSEDIEDLAQQMQKALAQKPLLPKLAEAGKELVSERYTYDYVIKRYSNAYKKLMSINNL
jgi:glycosyltransferase involved in cell wall biosynthesis